MVTGRLDWAQRATPAGDGAASDREMGPERPRSQEESDHAGWRNRRGR